MSLYLPEASLDLPPQARKNQLRQLLEDAHLQLQKQDFSQILIWHLLRPAETFLENDHFWQMVREGLAIYLTPDGMFSFQLPLQVEPLVWVSDRFYLKPLFPCIASPSYAYILALSEKRTQLYQATATTISKVPLFYGLQVLNQANVCASPGVRTLPRVRERSTLLTVEKRDALHQICSRIDVALQTYLSSEPVPLLLVAERDIQAIYRYTNTLPNLLNVGLEHNPDDLPLEILHRMAWENVEPWLRRSRESDIQRFNALQALGQANSYLEQIVPAACQGRVETLFVMAERQYWGQIDLNFGALEQVNDTHPQDGGALVDLLDLAATQTFLRGGKVYVVPVEEMPASAPMSAIYQRAHL
ncbi:hypothetical protein [Leptolyngbya sp. NM3-A1]|uniref:baeRF3 domain-containing protein n=1 Tax=Leptolyngbya sp. NM3-A1 TaxID=2933910 RepID=UPI003298C5A8